MTLWRISGLAISLGLPALVAAWGQVALETRPQPPSSAPLKPDSNIRVDSNLVLVPVTVCDPLNRPITSLQKDNFHVFDDGVEQTISHFSRDDEPVAVGLVFDTSASMSSKLYTSRLAVEAFFKTANPEDEFFLIEFNDQAKLVTPLTGDVERIQDEVLRAPTKGHTALLDAVYLALHEIKKSGKSRKALLIISDGGDNNSRYTQTEVKGVIQETDVIVYAIGIFGGRRRSLEEASGPALLHKLTEPSGGHMISVRDIVQLPYIAAKIGNELRNRYVLGYSPTDQQQDGHYHRVKVKVNQPSGSPPLRAFWRMGYYAPSK
jgi:Ca-activated chloride channel homolog